MTEEASLGARQKKQRTLQLGSSTAPPGYHYEGEKCSMLNGKPTLKLRRDKEGPREDIYGDGKHFLMMTEIDFKLSSSTTRFTL